jgi:glycosyltransferase involved in cell wall biosynthesis
VVHVWDAASLSVAGWLSAPRIVASFTGELPRRRRSGETSSRIHWICSTPYQLTVARERFGGRDRCTLIEPGVRTRVQPSTGQQALRTRLGLAEADRVLLAPGESTRNAGHDVAVWVTSMLHIIDPRYKLLIAGTGAFAEAARKRAAALNRSGLLRVAADRGVGGPLAEAADAVLFTPTGVAPVLAVAECMAEGLPVVTTDHPSVRGFLADGRGALLVEWKKAPAIARRVLELFEQPQLRETTAAQARDEAARRFTAGEFVKRCVAVYLESPELEPREASAGASRGNGMAAFA